MQQIIKANKLVMQILGKGKATPTASGYRLIKYCIPLQIPEGILLFHLLTREMVLLTPEEYAEMFASSYLKEHWFVIPEEIAERELVDLVRWTRSHIRQTLQTITGYTILTTTDCNARCFYCYEQGCARVNMSEETAHKVVAFIKEHNSSKPVNISWFGGEPLMNPSVIDLICEGLRTENIPFRSRMTSNGYLFDNAMISKATESWNLKNVQITLDGTEAVYNDSKAFIYPEGSAYQVVIHNIARLLEAGISVVVRLNMHLKNAENLMALVEELATRFAGQKLLRVYAHLLFDTELPWDKQHTPTEWTQLYDTLYALEDKLRAHGMFAATGFRLRRDLPLSQCMADNGKSVVIVPDGHLGLCEHYTESEFFGHIDSPAWDKAMIASWQEHCEEQPECSDCFYYPECRMLKKCTGRMPCFSYKRNRLRMITEQAMQNEFRRWQKGATCNNTTKLPD